VKQKLLNHASGMEDMRHPQQLTINLLEDEDLATIKENNSDCPTGWTTEVRFPSGVGIFSVSHRAQTGSETHPVSYPMGRGGSFPGVRETRT